MKESTILKIVQWTLGFVVSLAIIITLLITSFEIAVYSDFDFYQKEYNKYNVLDDVQMEMEDVMTVTHEMMDYLKGKRENLNVDTIVADEPREFFNQREKDHMKDVQDLFLKGILIRRVAIGIAIAASVLFYLLKGNMKLLLPKIYRIGTLILATITAFLAILFSTDFTKYFTLFHEMFFNNDLWLLDPKTDLMINILPEGFFVDMSIRIVCNLFTSHDIISGNKFLYQ
jgi:integral membrane protein (TIGR01906 family)